MILFIYILLVPAPSAKSNLSCIYWYIFNISILDFLATADIDGLQVQGALKNHNVTKQVRQK